MIFTCAVFEVFILLLLYYLVLFKIMLTTVSCSLCPPSLALVSFVILEHHVCAPTHGASLHADFAES